LENWKHLLKSIKLKFEVWTDYKNLIYLEICTREKITKANKLSRRPDWKVRIENDIKNKKLKKSEFKN